MTACEELLDGAVFGLSARALEPLLSSGTSLPLTAHSCARGGSPAGLTRVASERAGRRRAMM